MKLTKYSPRCLFMTSLTFKSNKPCCQQGFKALLYTVIYLYFTQKPRIPRSVSLCGSSTNSFTLLNCILLHSYSITVEYVLTICMDYGLTSPWKFLFATSEVDSVDVSDKSISPFGLRRMLCAVIVKGLPIK